jgi:uncharacterized protein with von Willebrand factor type A (vWA) domain
VSLAPPARANYANLAHNVIAFTRLLRAQDFPVSPAEVQDVLRAACVIDIGDRHEFYLTLRSVLLWDPKRRPEFDQLFERFWGAWSEEMAAEQEPVPQYTTGSMQEAAVGQGDTYSPMEVLLQKDFAEFRPDELGAVARACVEIARRIAMRKSRRLIATHRGSRIDPRRSIRRNVKHGGTVIELARLERKIRKPRLVLICDVSRSMEQYSVFLLQFIHSMQNIIGKVDSYVFSTALHRVSHYFKHADIMAAIDDISHEIPDWSGGTRIGESLRTFNEHYARSVVDRRTVVIILSDGLDTGQTDLLAEQMEELHSRAARVIWLNPLLGRDNYEPLARGMAAALPYVDVFAAAHNLASLQNLVEALSGRPNVTSSFSRASAATT